MKLEELAKQKVIEYAKMLKNADIDREDEASAMDSYLLAMVDMNLISEEDGRKIVNYYYSKVGYSCSITNNKDTVLPEWFALEG